MFMRCVFLAASIQSILGAAPSDPSSLIQGSRFPRFALDMRVGPFSFDVDIVIRQAPVDDNGMMIGKADFRIAVTVPLESGDQVTVSRVCDAEEYLQEGDLLIFPAIDDPRQCTMDFIDDLNRVMPGVIENEIALRYNPEDQTLNVNIVAPVTIPFRGLVRRA